MADYFPKITAKTVDEFKQVEEKLKALPKHIRDQVEIAEKTPASQCTCMLRKNYNAKVDVYLPNNPHNITHYDDYIAVYYACGYLFRLGEGWLDAKVSYQFETK